MVSSFMWSGIIGDGAFFVSAVDIDLRSCYIDGFIAGEECTGPCNVVYHAYTAGGYPTVELLPAKFLYFLPIHFRLDRSGRHGDNTDMMRGKFESQAFGHHIQSGLGRAVMYQSFPGHFVVDGGYIEDNAAVLCHHPFARRLRADESAANIYVQHPVPVFQVEVDGVIDGLAAGVVNQYVDATPLLVGQPEKPGHILRKGNICVTYNHLRLILLPQLTGQFLSMVFIPQMIDEYPRPASRHYAGDRRPDATARTCDQYPPALEIDVCIHDTFIL